MSAIRAAFLYPIHFEMERRMAADHDHQEIMDDGEEVRNTPVPNDVNSDVDDACLEFFGSFPTDRGSIHK